MRGEPCWTAVLLLLLTHIKSIRHGGNYSHASKLPSEDFFLDNTDSFFNPPSTRKPSFDEAADKFFDVKDEQTFFKKEETLFDKMKADEAFFFKEEMRKNKKKLQEEANQNQTEVQEPKGRYCNCKDVFCGCCSSINIFGKKRFVGCVDMEYVARDFAIFMTLSVNGHEIITRVVSGRNPLPFCAHTPYVPLVSFCIRLYDIHHNPRGVSLCMRLEVVSMRQILFSVSFDCIKIDEHRISFYKPPNATTFGVVGLHLGDTDPYVSYQDFTKLHFPLPEVTAVPPSTVAPSSRHRFFWYNWK